MVITYFHLNAVDNAVTSTETLNEMFKRDIDASYRNL